MIIDLTPFIKVFSTGCVSFICEEILIKTGKEDQAKLMRLVYVIITSMYLVELMSDLFRTLQVFKF